MRVTETLPTSETAQTESATIRRATDSRMLRPIGGELTLWLRANATIAFFKVAGGTARRSLIDQAGATERLQR